MIEAALTFVLPAAVLVLAATALTKAGDAISLTTGIGRVWIGAVLVAGATSLPELATDVAAVRIGAADLAAGDLFGSSMANMLILAVIDLMPSPTRNVLRRAAFDNTLTAALAIILNALAAMLVLTRSTFTVLGTGPGSLMLMVIFVLGMRTIYRQSARQQPVAVLAAETRQATLTPGGGASVGPVMSLRRAIAQFGAAALVILMAAPFLATGAKQIAELSGLGSTFVGTLLVALVTSLPELVASVVAVRVGALDLAVGNLFGSCAFNMVVFLAMDLAAPGSIFAVLDAGHGVSAVAAIVLMGLGLAAIVYRAERRFWFIEPDAALIVAAYLAAVCLLYAHVT